VDKHLQKRERERESHYLAWKFKEGTIIPVLQARMYVIKWDNGKNERKIIFKK